MNSDAALKLALYLLSGTFDYRVVAITTTPPIDGPYLKVDNTLMDTLRWQDEYELTWDPKVKLRISMEVSYVDLIDQFTESGSYYVVLAKTNITAKQVKLHKTYMQMAKVWGDNMSYCVRKKVGCLVVKDHMIISDGYNGMPAKFPNQCELESGDTDPRVLHAEANAITKLAKSTCSGVGSTLYVTLSPCMECSKLLVQTEVKEVVFSRIYSDISGLKLLLDAGIAIYYHV